MRSELLGRQPSATLVVAVIVSLLAGAAVMYWIMRPARGVAPIAQPTPEAGPAVVASTPGMDAPPTSTAPSPARAAVPVVVSLSREAVERAGLVVTPVRAGAGPSVVRIPGVVEPDAYREVVVTPIVAGRITRVSVRLGDQVRRGQTIAQVHSPQLADAQTRYLSAQAELDAAAQQLRRTERLVEIGAASRQELEDVRAEHTTRAAAVQGARSQLVLFGMSPAAIEALSAPSAIAATTGVPAPIDGIVTKRAANIGLNVDPATELFTVVDLSTVWIVGDLYEQDFRRVRVGTGAEITTTAYPDEVLRGKVSYIDPELSSDTRTARVRVEVPNRDRRLRLGMFAQMLMTDGDEDRVAMVPSVAVQTLGNRTVVYVVDGKQSGRFIEREVTLGKPSGDSIQVLSGVRPGEDVVAQGSFFVRAERERVNPSAAAAPAALSNVAPASSSRNTATVKVTERGFEPDRVSVPRGGEATITFVRTTDATCATEVAIPSLNVKRPLPLNQPVTILVRTDRDEVQFVCGMNMFKGAVIVQ